MNFQDIISQIKDRIKSLWAQFEESSTYQQLMDKYEDLSPRNQKLVQIGSVAFVILIMLMIPLSDIFSSSDFVTEFEEKREITRDLLRTSRDANQAPNIPQPPDPGALQTRIQAELQNLRLNPDQIKSVTESPSNSQLIPDDFAKGAVQINVSSLNTRQIVDISFQLANIHPSVKMTDLEINASTEKPGYFDLMAKIVSLKPPEVTIAQAEPEEPKSRGNKKDSENEEQPPASEEE
jgi:hypothetical protein